jgi:hypothetical protein
MSGYHKKAAFNSHYVRIKSLAVRTMLETESLRCEITRFAELRRRLLEADPDIDERSLFDTLEGATNLKEAIGDVIRSALDDETLAEALKSRLSEMHERLKRIEATAEKKRQVALAAMEEADIEKILEPDFTVSLRAVSPGVVITSEQDIPEWFWIPQPAKLDKRALLEAMKAGTAVTGAELSNSRITLAIRTK